MSAGWEPGADLGPVISKEAKARIERLIASGIDQVRGEAFLGAACGSVGRFYHKLLESPPYGRV